MYRNIPSFPTESRFLSKPKLSLAVVRLIVLAVVLIGATITVAVVGTDGVAQFLEDSADSRLGILAFMGIYILGVVLMVPGTIGTLTAGAVFGFTVGFPVAFVSAFIGAMISFGISRAVGKEGMTQLLGERLRGIDEWLMDNDFVSILILRLMPIVPFNGLNYAAGVTSVRFSRYAAASALGIAPGSALATGTAAMASEPSSALFIALAGALIAVTVISTLVARRWTKNRRATFDPPTSP